MGTIKISRSGSTIGVGVRPHLWITHKEANKKKKNRFLFIVNSAIYLPKCLEYFLSIDYKQNKPRITRIWM